ncbi:hypothetical protein GCM10020331_022120 [Ectobacillus funiculus]
MPGLIGWSAVNRFGGSPLLGIVLGLMLVHPDLLNAWGYGAAKEIPKWNLFGLDVQKGWLSRSGIAGITCFLCVSYD